MNMLGHPNSFQPRILVSDVNETLLEVDALRPHFQRIFGTSEVLRHWFSQTLLYSQTLTLIGKYADFMKIALRSLEMTAQSRSVHLSEEDVSSIRSAMKMLPAHADVPGSLQRLRKAGFRLIALTNSPRRLWNSRCERQGLRQCSRGSSQSIS